MRIWMFLALSVFACGERPINDDPMEALRAKVEDQCQRFCEFSQQCSPYFEEANPGGIPECFEKCVVLIGWYVQGECGEVFWDYEECRMTLTCEQLDSHVRGNWFSDETAPCRDEAMERAYGVCHVEYLDEQ